MFSTSRLLLSLRKKPQISRAYNTNLAPLQNLSKNIPHVGMVLVKNKTTGDFYKIASGIYDDGIIISSAHCFSTPLVSYYFILGGDNNLQPIKIKNIAKHPEYNEENEDKIGPQGQADIAVALLEKKFSVALPKLEIEYHPTNLDLENCISVGYPDKYFPILDKEIPGYLEEYSPTPGNPHIPLGVTASCYLSTKYLNCLEHKIGYYKGVQPVSYSILDSGTHCGMSGGGLFTQKDNKLIGVNMCTDGAAIWSAHRTGNICFFNFLSPNEVFLTKQINKFKNLLPLTTQKTESENRKTKPFRIL